MCIFACCATARVHDLLQPLPDALRGEKWAFVQLPLSNLREMLKPVGTVSVRFVGVVLLVSRAGGGGGGLGCS
jgi:hypothetical protein